MLALVLLLTQFLLRVSFGVATAMALTPPRLVTAGFYRVHLWVLLGLNTLAALAAYSSRAELGTWPAVAGLAAGGAALSYAGAVLWMYERRDAGMFVLYLVAAASLAGAALASPWGGDLAKGGGIGSPLSAALILLDLASSGLLLGTILTAMLLGHWYLNTPTMQLLPLRRLLILLAAAVLVRTLVSGTGLAFCAWEQGDMSRAWWLFIALRWLSGLLGVLFLARLTWLTLRIPNTQSATGILYAGVILCFVGELTSQLLSVDSLYPV